jgi:hypothetical protein
LLSTGSSPHQLVSVEYRLNSDLDGEKVMESRKVPVWMVFLRKMAGEYLDLDESVADLDLETRMRRSRAFSLTLEQYLKFGADRNIYFLGYLGPAKGERRANYQPPAEELFSVELLQFVQLYQPENLDSIQKLLIGSVAHQAWNQTTHLLGRFTPLLSSSRPMKTTKYRPEKLDELREKTWRVYGVISETCELLGAFSYRIY